jgi:hypothetical protein
MVRKEPINAITKPVKQRKRNHYLVTTKQMWDFYVQIIAEGMMNFSYSLFHKQTGCASKELTMYS